MEGVTAALKQYLALGMMLMHPMCDHAGCYVCMHACTQRRGVGDVQYHCLYCQPGERQFRDIGEMVSGSAPRRAQRPALGGARQRATALHAATVCIVRVSWVNAALALGSYPSMCMRTRGRQQQLRGWL